MNTIRQQTIRPARGRQRASVMQVLDKWLGPEMPFSNAERIRLMREAHFADVAALLKSGTLKLPK